MKIRALHDYVIVEVDKPPEKTESGLLFYPELRGDDTTPESKDALSGTVVGVGPGNHLPVRPCGGACRGVRVTRATHVGKTPGGRRKYRCSDCVVTTGFGIEWRRLPERFPMSVAPGQRVMFSKWAGQNYNERKAPTVLEAVGDQRRDWRMMHDAEILGIVEP